jgi:hypothetical protein
MLGCPPWSGAGSCPGRAPGWLHAVWLGAGCGSCCCPAPLLELVASACCLLHAASILDPTHISRSY